MKTKIEKDIEAAIRLLRFMTHGEGYASLSVFDAGAGGGFSNGHIQVNLERSGQIGKAESYDVEEFAKKIRECLSPYSNKTIEEINESYKNRKWND